MSAWFATPHAAMAVVGRDRDARCAVLDLYERAHLTGYAPRLFTGRDLAEEWGMDRDGVERILAKLEAAGCVSLQRSAPGSKRQSVLVVLPPVSADRQTPRQTPDQNNHGSAPLQTPEPPDAAPDAAPACAEETPVQRPDRDGDKREHSVGPPALADRYDEVALFFGEVVHRQLGRRPSKGPSRGTKLGQRLLSAVRKDPEEVLDAMRFIAHSETSTALFLRGERADATDIDTVLRHAEKYAKLWREYGDRPVVRTRAGPTEAPRHGSGGTVGDGVLQRLWDLNNTGGQGHGDE